MADTSAYQTTTTSLASSVKNFSVSSAKIDEETTQRWFNPYTAKYRGFYRTIPEFKKAIDAFTIWVCGKGYKVNDMWTGSTLDFISGNGKQTFLNIMLDMLRTKKWNGDAYAEIIRDPETNQLVNLKVLNPENVTHLFDMKGIITGYEIRMANGQKKVLTPDKVFHLINDQDASEVHGVSVVEACQWIIEARNEAMTDKRRILHRSTIRVIEVDADKSETLTKVKNEYANAIKNGEVMVVPKGNVGFPDVAPLTMSEHSDWIRYLESAFYIAVGVPEIIMGGSQAYSEASSKVGHMTFEQPHKAERKELEDAIWNQLQLKVDFDEPASLMDTLQESEAANTGQVTFQQNDMTASMTRSE